MVSIFWESIFSSFFISSASCMVFDERNIILFQIKIFGRKIEEPPLESYFIKVTADPSFTWLQIKRVYEVLNCEICHKDSSVENSVLEGVHLNMIV